MTAASQTEPDFPFFEPRFPFFEEIKTDFLYNHAWGYSYRVPGYLVRDTLEDWLGEAKKRGQQISTYVLSGLEFNDLDHVKQVLEAGRQCKTVQVMFGGELSSQDKRETLKALLQIQGEVLEVYQLPEQPKVRWIMLNDNTINEAQGRFDPALILERMPKKFWAKYSDQFALLKRDAVRITPANIDQVKVRA